MTNEEQGIVDEKQEAVKDEHETRKEEQAATEEHEAVKEEHEAAKGEHEAEEEALEAVSLDYPPTHIFLCPWADALSKDRARYINGYANLFPGTKVSILPREHEILPSSLDIGSQSPEFRAAVEALKSPSEPQAVLVHMIGLEGMFTAAQLLYWYNDATGRKLNVRCTVEQPVPADVVTAVPWSTRTANETWKLLVGPSDDLVQQRVLATLYDKSLTNEGIRRCRFGRGRGMDGEQVAVGESGEERGKTEEANRSIIEAAWYGKVAQ